MENISHAGCLKVNSYLFLMRTDLGTGKRVKPYVCAGGGGIRCENLHGAQHAGRHVTYLCAPKWLFNRCFLDDFSAPAFLWARIGRYALSP